MDMIWIGLLASFVAGMGTGVGALPVLLPIQLTERVQAILLGVGGGVMLAATSFSLIIPGTEAAVKQGLSEGGAALVMAAGILLGGFFLWFAHNHFPHEHFFKGQEGQPQQTVKRIWLFIIAIALHNFPEGLAVGVGFGSGDMASGLTLAAGIGLQNMPEGLVVAIALRQLGYSVRSAVGISTLTGLVEPIGGLLGVGIVSVAASVLPWGMAFAAGAMLFVIVDEIIPDVAHKGWGQEGTLGAMVGFVIMMVMDISLG